MLNNIFNNKTIPIVLIALLPIGLLISSGVSEFLSILIVIFYIIHLIFKKDYSIINNSYFKLLLILWIYLILNSLLSENYEINEYSFRSFGFIKYILLIFAFAHYFNKSENIKLVFLFWSCIIFIVSFDIFFEHFSGKNILGFESMHPARIISFLRKEHKIGHFMLGFSFLIISYLFLESKKKSVMFLFFCYFIFITLIVSIFNFNNAYYFNYICFFRKNKK